MKKRKSPAPMSNSLIVKSNKLIQAYYKMSVWQMRIVNSLIARIKRDDKNFQSFTFDIPEMLSKYQESSSRNYDIIINAVEGLRKKDLALKEDDKTIRLNFMSSASYFTNGKIEVELSPKLTPYLLQLKGVKGLNGGFTSYEEENVIPLKSFFSIRMYELAKQNQFLRYGTTFKIDELRKIFGLEDDQYVLYGDFKRRVLLRAQKELRKKTDICFSFQEVKDGRKVIALKIKVYENKKVTRTNQALFDRIKKRLNIKDSRIKEIIDEYDEDKIIIALDTINSKKHIKNKAGYFQTLLNTDSFAIEEIEKKRLQEEKARKELEEKQKQEQEEAEQKEREKIAKDWMKENPEETEKIKKEVYEENKERTMFLGLPKNTQRVIIHKGAIYKILKILKND